MCYICDMLARGGGSTALTYTSTDEAPPKGESLPATPPWLEVAPTGLPDDAGTPGITDASFAGQSALLPQYFANGVYNFSGNRDIDGVLIGSKWANSLLTYSFPTAGSNYGTNYPDGLNTTLDPFNPAQQTAVRAGLAMVASYTGLTFVQITETDLSHATLRFAQTRDSDVPSAQGLFPGDRADAGDVWFGQSNPPQPFYATPAAGNWGWATQLHELGHVLGMKHGQDNYTAVNLSAYFGTSPRYGSAALPSSRDGQAWSLMTYRSNPGASVVFQGEGFNQPQTYMQNDIAALQYMYGANFNSNATASTYTWSPTTGQMSINGVGQGAPTSNKILLTVWDGGGDDTYDLSNYTTPLTLDLRPGGFSTFSAAQLVNHQARSGGTAIAVGNVGNALQYQGDARSLIENAIGGPANDVLTGNAANNRLTGGAGADILYGLEGDDVLTSGSGGTRTTATPRPDIAKPQSVANASLATAVALDGAFDLDADADVDLSTTRAHATVRAVGHGGYEWYSFTLPAAGTIRLDIDGTASSFDSYLSLVTPGGTTVAFNDDAGGDPGSANSGDSALTYTATAAGTWYVRVARYVSAGTQGTPPAGTAYTLHVSATSAPLDTVTFTGSVLDGGTGNDTLNAGPSADLLYGGDGFDILNGGAGGDVLYGGQGADVLYGNPDNDVLYGNTENDQLYGGQGNDAAYGGQGDDALFGNLGDDLLFGNLGNDTLNGGAGINTLDGGDGTDTASYADATAGVTVNLSLTAAQSTGVSTDTLIGIENLVGSPYADILTGSAGVNTISGGVGTDTLYGGVSADTLYGNQDADVLYGNQDADTLYGGQGDDVLYGGQGEDVLYGNVGADTLFGNLGLDVFRYAGAADSSPTVFDLLADFTPGQDRIDLRAVRTGTGMTDAYSLATANGTTVLDVDLGNNGSVDMRIVILGTPTAADIDWG